MYLSLIMDMPSSLRHTIFRTRKFLEKKQKCFDMGRQTTYLTMLECVSLSLSNYFLRNDAFGVAEQEFWTSLYKQFLPLEDKEHADEPWSDFMVRI
jgi:hypothetical protein